MFKRINTFIIISVTFIIYTYPQAAHADTDLSANAAEYICTKAKEGKKTRLAIYTFTNDTGDTSPESKVYSTKIMAIILDKKEFKVIDPEKIPEVVNEQEKGLTGLIDPETAAETGKLIGADALVFGVSGKGSLQVRIIDAATGEVLGAKLEENGGKPTISNEDFKSPEAKKKFIAFEFERDLTQLYRKRPMLYLYVTADEKELSELEENFPEAIEKLKLRINEKDPKKNAKFERRKRNLSGFRKENPGFDKRIRNSRKSLFDQLKKEKNGRSLK